MSQAQHQEPIFPDDVEHDKPSAARMYDYLLGGYHNFEIDRLVMDKFLTLYPEGRAAAQVNRALLRRIVTFLARQGIEQFLDIGSGIPTVGHVHEIAGRINPATRVVYVDIDPIAVAHSKAILQDNSHVLTIQADARVPESIFEHPEVRTLLDLSKPVAVLLIALLHFIPDDQQVHNLICMARNEIAPGSYLALAHGTYDNAPPEVIRQLELITRRTTSPAKYRTRTVIKSFFEGFELLPPGLVYSPLWQPDSEEDLMFDAPERSLTLSGVGYLSRK